MNQTNVIVCVYRENSKFYDTTSKDKIESVLIFLISLKRFILIFISVNALNQYILLRVWR